jgi:hypothetical protein
MQESFIAGAVRIPIGNLNGALSSERGIASLCIGGGGAVALAVELC